MAGIGGDERMLDPETSAAIIRWLEIAVTPAAIDPDRWQHWVDKGCSGEIDATGAPVTPAMLGHWARTGALG
jgi:hypothetical protein